MRAIISHEDENNLSWWFRQVAFERSPSGAMLERASLFVTAAREQVARRNIALATARMRRKANEPWDVAPLTAIPTAELRAAAREEPNLDDLLAAAFVSRRLAAMERAGARRQLGALELYYGHVGAHFEDRDAVEDQPMPRVYALLHVTEAGQLLLKRAPKTELDLPPYGRMRVHFMMRDRKDYRGLQELFALAEVEAEQLYASACISWNAAAAAGAQSQVA